METKFTWDRVSSDGNGNPRYVVHFTEIAALIDPDYKMRIEGRYAAACKLMNTIGGRKFHNKQYGGGIVFQSYSLPDTERHIMRAVNDYLESEK